MDELTVQNSRHAQIGYRRIVITIDRLEKRSGVLKWAVALTTIEATGVGWRNGIK